LAPASNPDDDGVDGAAAFLGAAAAAVVVAAVDGVAVVGFFLAELKSIGFPSLSWKWMDGWMIE
jgi:hypothetical protein